MEEYIKPILSQTGFAGALLVLGYYLVGRRLISLEQAVREMIEAKIMGIVANPHISSELKQEAAKALEKNTAARKRLDQ